MKRLLISTFAMAVLSLPATAYAADTAFTNNVATVDQRIIALVKSREKDGYTKLDSDAVTTIIDIVAEDREVTDVELHFLTELLGSSVAPLRLRGEGSTSTLYRDMPGVGRVWGESASPIRDALYAQYRTLWTGGDSGHRQLLAHHTIGKTQAELLKRFAVREMLDPAWSDSTVQNAYEPIRKSISELMGHNKGLDESLQPDSRYMIHSWLVSLDQLHGDAVPDFLYRWIRPKD